MINVMVGKSNDTPLKYEKSSWLVKFGNLLSIVLPPLGLAISLVIRFNSKRQADRRSSLFGIIVGIVFMVPFLILLPIIVLLTGDTFRVAPNPAYDKAKPLLETLRALGGAEICHQSFNDHSTDSQAPWYRAYYQVPDSPSLTDRLRDTADEMGFEQLITDPRVQNDPTKLDIGVNIRDELKKSDGRSEFLVPANIAEGSRDAEALSLNIFRAGPVDPSCEGVGPTHIGQGKAIVEFYLSLKRLDLVAR